jgi:CheY-like chemotaxis protein
MTKLLLVDDDEVMLFGLHRLLQQAGHEVLMLNDGTQVPYRLEQERPDVLICDIIMPQREGIETIIQARKAYPDLVIIAMSVNELYLDMARRLGANATLQKQFDDPAWADELLAKIKELTGNGPKP